MTSTQEKTVDLLEVFERTRYENALYRDLIFEFVTRNNLDDKFAEFLDESIKQENYTMLDLEHIVMDYR